MKFMFFVFCSSRPHSAIFLGRTEGSEEVVCPLHHSGGFHENKSGLAEMKSEMTGLFCLHPVRLPPCPCRVFWTAWFMPGGVQTSRRPCSGRTCRWRLTCPFLMNHYEATADRELLHVYCCAAIRVMSTKKTGAMAVQTGRFQWTEEERNKRMKDLFDFSTKTEHYRRCCCCCGFQWKVRKSAKIMLTQIIWWIRKFWQIRIKRLTDYFVRYYNIVK